MKVKKAKLGHPIMLPGYVRSEDTLSSVSHKTIEMITSELGLVIKIGPHVALVPYSNIRWLELEPNE